jgi:two-component system cell cycle response regulator
MYLGMALRVLLADESSTIKKAIQMVLSDYGVEVKTVPTGIDVLSVTQSFTPDIIIADILLNKKNGYEVCLELKAKEDTKNIPVVLMWSSFMQLDAELFKASRADASLEKPFETETIRNLVEKLVPKLQTFPLKGFLNHAPMPNFEESDTFVRQKTDYNTLSEKPAPIQLTDNPIAENIQKSTLADEAEWPPQQDEWSSAKTNQFVIETENFGDFEEVKVINSLSDDKPDLQKKINEQIQNYLKDSPVAAHKSQNQQKSSSAQSSFDEQLMREEIRQIAERICWQIIPEVTEKVVREELGKLMQGIENKI